MTLTADQIAAVTRTPRPAIIGAVEIHFAAGVARYCGEAYTVTVGGVTWAPAHALLGEFPEALETVGLSAATATITASGVDPAWSRLLAAEWGDIDGALVRTAALLLDPQTRQGLAGGVIYTSSFRAVEIEARGNAGAIGEPPTNEIEIVLESLWRGRRSSGLEYLTDAGQKARYAGDTGFQYLTELELSRIQWPVP